MYLVTTELSVEKSWHLSVLHSTVRRELTFETFHRMATAKAVTQMLRVNVTNSIIYLNVTNFINMSHISQPYALLQLGNTWRMFRVNMSRTLSSILMSRTLSICRHQYMSSTLCLYSMAFEVAIREKFHTYDSFHKKQKDFGDFRDHQFPLHFTRMIVSTKKEIATSPKPSVSRNSGSSVSRGTN